MGNPDAALASALGAVVGEIAIETLDAMEQKPGKTMTPQERQALEKMEAQKELDQKTNTSIFKMAIQKRNIANLAAALFLTLTTPDHLVADAYHAAQRAMDFNHDVSSLRAKDKEEENERAQALQEIKETLKGHVVEGVTLNFEGTLTPRRLAGLAAYIEVQQINAEKAYLAAHPPMIGVDNAAFMGALENPMDAFDQAYLKTQSQLAVGYTLKHKAGETLTDYERTVRTQDRQAHQRYIKRMAGYVGGAALGVGAVLTAPVTVPGAVVIGALGGGLEGLASVDYEVKSKTDAALVVGSTILGAAVPGSGKAVQQAIKSTLTHAGDLALSKAVTSKMIQTNAPKGLVDHLGLEVPKPTHLPKGVTHDKLILNQQGQWVLDSSKFNSSREYWKASDAIIKDGKLFQEHHIISDKFHKTADHDLWKAAGIDPNSELNKMFMPTKKGAQFGTNMRSIHDGKHLGEVNKNLAEKMSQAMQRGQKEVWTQEQYAQALRGIIREERIELTLGNRMLNKNARPHAKPLDLENR